MFCCICQEQCSKNYAERGNVKKIIGFDIAFCETHNFLHYLEAEEMCEVSFHIHDIRRRQVMMTTFILSQLNQAPYINSALKGSTIHDTLVRMSKIDLLLYH